MEAYFNELSKRRITGEEYITQYGDVQNLAGIYGALKKENINVCRTNYQIIREIMKDIQRMGQSALTIRNFLFGFLQAPYENEAVEAKADQYLNVRWNYMGKECYGLALAYLMDSLSVSIGEEQWNSPSIEIIADDEKKIVRNVYSADHVETHQEWLYSLKDLNICPCSLSPREKRIHLREDHGIDTIKRFADRLVRSMYVCEVVNSLPYNQNTKHFIKKIKEDGLIEIVLPWTDEGLGLVVRTSGRNTRETTAIAEILYREYGRG